MGRLVALPVAAGLKIHDPQGPFQPVPLCDSVIRRLVWLLIYFLTIISLFPFFASKIYFGEKQAAIPQDWSGGCNSKYSNTGTLTTVREIRDVLGNVSLNTALFSAEDTTPLAEFSPTARTSTKFRDMWSRARPRRAAPCESSAPRAGGAELHSAGQRGAGTASARLHRPQCTRARWPRLRAVPSGRCAQPQCRGRAHFEPGQFFSVGSCRYGARCRSARQIGADGSTAALRRSGGVVASASCREAAPCCSGAEGRLRSLLRLGKSLGPGRSGAAAVPSVTICAGRGGTCPRRSRGRSSSTPLRMAPPSTGPALPSEWSPGPAGRSLGGRARPPLSGLEPGMLRGCGAAPSLRLPRPGRPGFSSVPCRAPRAELPRGFSAGSGRRRGGEQRWAGAWGELEGRTLCRWWGLLRSEVI